MEENKTHRFFEDENMDKNSSLNIICNLLPQKNETQHDTVDQMNKCFKELSIQPHVECNKEEPKYLVGRINNIITTLHTVVVKPFYPDKLLHIGTPLFLIDTRLQNYKSQYILFGYIDDIFGSLGAPMYSVAITCTPIQTLNINAQVYYSPNHPQTSYMYVEHAINKVSNNAKYKIEAKTTKM